MTIHKAIRDAGDKQQTHKLLTWEECDWPMFCVTHNKFNSVNPELDRQNNIAHIRNMVTDIDTQMEALVARTVELIRRLNTLEKE